MKMLQIKKMGYTITTAGVHTEPWYYAFSIQDGWGWSPNLKEVLRKASEEIGAIDRIISECLTAEEVKICHEFLVSQNIKKPEIKPISE